MASILNLLCMVADEGADGQRTLFGAPLGFALGLITTATFCALDAATDIATIVSFAAAGDWSWFVVGLAVQLGCGAAIGLIHAYVISVRANTGRCSSLKAHASTSPKHVVAHTSQNARSIGSLIGSLIGALGLAPVFVGIVALKDWSTVHKEDEGTYDAEEEKKAEMAQQDTRLVYMHSALELVLESVPQAVLQTYIGISYGELAVDSDEFSPMLAFSVLCSFLASGVVMFDLESEQRNQDLSSSARLTLFSWYGVVTAIGRGAQVAALVLSSALCVCAFKGWASVTVLLSLVVLLALTMHTNKMQSRGGMNRWLSPNQAEMCEYGTHTLFVLLLAALFYSLPHVPNDYAARASADDEMSSSPSAQHLDCRERTVGTTALATSLAVSVSFMVISMMLDQEWGFRTNNDTRNALYIERDEEDAAAESKVAMSYVNAHRECTETEQENTAVLVRIYREAMIEQISQEIVNFCESHCTATGQAPTLEVQWKFRQQRKLRWEHPAYFLSTEYRAWAFEENEDEDQLYRRAAPSSYSSRSRRKVSAKIIRQQSVDAAFVDEYDILLDCFLSQKYAHPRSYKWEEQALWEARTEVVALTKQLSFDVMYVQIKPGSSRDTTCCGYTCRSCNSGWERFIVQLVPGASECSARLETFDMEHFNSTPHSAEATSTSTTVPARKLEPLESVRLDEVTYCGDPLSDLGTTHHAMHAIELRTNHQLLIIAPEFLKLKALWAKRIAAHLPKDVTVQEGRPLAKPRHFRLSLKKRNSHADGAQALKQPGAARIMNPLMPSMTGDDELLD